MDSAASATFVSPATWEPRRLPKLSDEWLARAAARGAERACAAIYERYHQPIYAYARSIVRHDQDAQDVVQATFANALAALADREPRAPLRPWLYRIAHNEAISLLRRRRRHSSDALEESNAPLAPSAEDEAAARDRWASLTADLGELPERQREALLLRELAGLSHTEIAIVLETTVGGAKQSILEARRALAEFGEGRAMDCETVQQKLSDGDRRVLRGRRVSAHLRGCASCDAFARSIDQRQAQLQALCPTLPAGAAAALFAGALRSGLLHGARAGSSGTTGASAAGAGMAGKVAVTASTWKAVTGAAVIIASSAGVAELHQATVVHHRRAIAASHHQSPARGAVDAQSTAAQGTASQALGASARSAGRAAAGTREIRGRHTGPASTSLLRSADLPRTGTTGDPKPGMGHGHKTHGHTIADAGAAAQGIGVTAPGAAAGPGRSSAAHAGATANGHQSGQGDQGAAGQGQNGNSQGHNGDSQGNAGQARATGGRGQGNAGQGQGSTTVHTQAEATGGQDGNAQVQDNVATPQAAAGQAQTTGASAHSQHAHVTPNVLSAVSGSQNAASTSQAKGSSASANGHNKN